MSFGRPGVFRSRLFNLHRLHSRAPWRPLGVSSCLLRIQPLCFCLHLIHTQLISPASVTPPPPFVSSLQTYLNGATMRLSAVLRRAFLFDCLLSWSSSVSPWLCSPPSERLLPPRSVAAAHCSPRAGSDRLLLMFPSSSTLDRFVFFSCSSLASSVLRLLLHPRLLMPTATARMLRRR